MGQEEEVYLRSLRARMSMFYGLLLLLIGLVAIAFVKTHENDYARLTTEEFIKDVKVKKDETVVKYKAGNDYIVCTQKTNPATVSCRFTRKTSDDEP